MDTPVLKCVSRIVFYYGVRISGRMQTFKNHWFVELDSVMLLSLKFTYIAESIKTIFTQSVWNFFPISAAQEAIKNIVYM